MRQRNRETKSTVGINLLYVKCVVDVVGYSLSLSRIVQLRGMSLGICCTLYANGPTDG